MNETLDKLMKSQPSTKTGLAALAAFVLMLLGYTISADAAMWIASVVLIFIGAHEVMRDEDAQAEKRRMKR